MKRRDLVLYFVKWMKIGIFFGGRFCLMFLSVGTGKSLVCVKITVAINFNASPLSITANYHIKHG